MWAAVAYGANAGGPGTRRRVPGPRGLQTARKPDFVLDDHSSRRRVTAALQQPTRKFRLSGRSQTKLSAWAHRADTLAPAESAGAIPAYLVLLRVGFTMRSRLRETRCALTAPFHPYLRSLARLPAVYSLLHWPSMRLEAHIPDVIRHTALRSPDFPPPLDAEARAAAIIQPPAWLV